MSDPFDLCCSECEQPLEIVAGGGRYCPTCKFAPSMQDTFLKRASIAPLPVPAPRRKTIDDYINDDREAVLDIQQTIREAKKP